jgi:hypothetical protein
MPVKRTKKQSKKQSGGMFGLPNWLTGKKEESQPVPASESVPESSSAPAPSSAPESSAPAPAPAGVEPLDVPKVNEAPSGEQAQAVGAESGEPPKPKTEEVRKPEGVEEPVVAKKTSLWPFWGGKSRRKRSKKSAKGSAKGSKRSAKKRSAKGAKSSAKGSAKGSSKRCSKKNCKSRKHKH